MINALLTGKLLKDPQAKTASNGNTFASASMTVANDGESLVANAIVFDAVAVSKLMALSKGDALSVVGSMSVKVYTGKDGASKPSLSIKVDSLLSSYEVEKKRRKVAEASPYVLSGKAVNAMKAAGDIVRQSDVSSLEDDLPW